MRASAGAPRRCSAARRPSSAPDAAVLRVLRRRAIRSPSELMELELGYIDNYVALVQGPRRHQAWRRSAASARASIPLMERAMATSSSRPQHEPLHGAVILAKQNFASMNYHRQETTERVQPHHSGPALRLCGVRRHRRPDQAQADPRALSSLQGRPVRRAEPHHRRVALQADRRGFPEGRRASRSPSSSRRNIRTRRPSTASSRSSPMSPTTSPTRPSGATSSKPARRSQDRARLLSRHRARSVRADLRVHPEAGLLPPRRPRGDRKAARPRPGIVDRRSTTRCPRSSRKIRSTASTTTSAKRRCRTCWRCALPTSSSSRSGTRPISTTCRSPWPSRSAPARAATTTSPARCAT